MNEDEVSVAFRGNVWEGHATYDCILYKLVISQILSAFRQADVLMVHYGRLTSAQTI